MKWTDVGDLAIELSEAHPEVDPRKINFVDLMNWVMALPGFDDYLHPARLYLQWGNPQRCNM